MARIRAPNLDDDAIAEIASILDGWSGKLSWELLIHAVKRKMHATYTRQALHNHARIKQSFALRKKALAETQAGGSRRSRPVSPELQALLDRIERIEAANARLQAENHALLGQVACWAYNAQTRGLTEAFLNRPLPEIDRDRTMRLAADKHRKQ
jgi:hypothetical protein